MKRPRFTEEEIISILREQEAGLSVTELRRKHGVGSLTFYKKPYAGCLAQRLSETGRPLLPLTTFGIIIRQRTVPCPMRINKFLI